jgi:NAD-dependent dihydropyrimidine dehydrogenase PreA subunit
MIELLLADRCTGCNRCVEICPTNVFDAVQGGRPVIARAEDCQTCFMCELYCQADALFVHPNADERVPVQPSAIVAAGLLGQYRRESGWDEWEGQYPNEQWMMEQVFRRAAAQNS